MSRLQPVSERELIDEPKGQVKQPTADHEVATKMLLMAISALGQRFVVALADLFTLLTAASAFWLWRAALTEADTFKIVACSIYSVFVLLLNVYGRRA